MRKVRVPNTEKINIINVNARFTEIPIIQPKALYTVSDILRLGLLPNIKNNLYCKTYVYSLITKKTVGEYVEPYTETTNYTIKPIDCRKIGNKYPRWKIEGRELLRFLHLNKML